MKKIYIGILLLISFIYIDVNASSDTAKLKKCVDGDTARFIIGNKEESVRFLAINTPEIKHGKNKAEPYGIEASNYTCKKLRNAKKIVIEYDDAAGKTDKYGRVLGWIFVDDNLLQDDLIKNGYAEVKYLYGNYKYTDTLKKSEKVAKKNKLKIWSNDKDSEIDDEIDSFLDGILDDLFKYVRKKIKSML